MCSLPPHKQIPQFWWRMNRWGKYEICIRYVPSTTKFDATVTSSDQVIRNQSMMCNEKALAKWANEKDELVSLSLSLRVWVCFGANKWKCHPMLADNICSLRWQQWQLSKNRWFMLRARDVEKNCFRAAGWSRWNRFQNKSFRLQNNKTNATKRSI